MPVDPSGKTAPGTTLKLGEAALIDFDQGEAKTGVVRMSVTAIEQGTATDLEGTEITEGLENKVPFYVRVTVSNEGDSGLDRTNVTTLMSIAGGQGLRQYPHPLFEFDKCRFEIAPAGFVRSRSYETCVVFAMPTGAVLQSVQGSGGIDTPTWDNPITWTK